VITAVDTNVLIDIFGGDSKFGKRSSQALRRCMQEGTVYACEVVFAETATVFSDQKVFLNAIHTLGIEFSAILQETSLVAAEAWRQYRQAGGKRERVVADFLIGSHALTQSERLGSVKE